MKARIVIGANFGDEGKGIVTDWLCSHGAGVVVRFNGGAQAGHTVVTPDGDRHIFRHFGSGTLLEVPTFLSQFFVVNPILFFEERKQLIELGYHPIVFAHPDCLVTTFADMMINQFKETKRGSTRHGSCGVGFHETIVRSKVDELKITMADLWNGNTAHVETQLSEICDKYARFRIGEKIDEPQACEVFIDCCKHFAQCIHPAGIGQCKDPVFEASQGLLLDQDNKEFYPHLTHSSTGMKNVEILCAQAGITDKEIYYVSRTYLTRHGAGPLPGEDSNLSYEDNTNHPTRFQGAIRFSPLDAGLRSRCHQDANGNPFKLVLTHSDQCAPNVKSDYQSFGPTRNDVKKF